MSSEQASRRRQPLSLVAAIVLAWLVWMVAAPWLVRQIDRADDADRAMVPIILWVVGTALALAALAAVSFYARRNGTERVVAHARDQAIVTALGLAIVFVGIPFLVLIIFQWLREYLVAWLLYVQLPLFAVGVAMWFGRNRPVLAASLTTVVVGLLWSGIVLWGYVDARTGGCWQNCGGDLSDGFAFAMGFIVLGVAALGFVALIWIGCGVTIVLRKRLEYFIATTH